MINTDNLDDFTCAYIEQGQKLIDLARDIYNSAHPDY